MARGRPGPDIRVTKGKVTARIRAATESGAGRLELAAEEGEGGIYTRVDVYRAFIRKVAKDAGVRM